MYSNDNNEQGDSALPEWLKIERVTSKGSDLLYYHSAVLISWPSDNGREGVVYTPHGVYPGSLNVLNGSIKILALLQGLHEVVNPW